MRTLNGIKITDFILLLLHGIKKHYDQSCLTGRTMVQKIVFLTTAETRLRKFLGVRYLMHFYGPYSSEVTEALTYLTTFGLAKEVRRETPDFVRYDLELESDGKEYAGQLYETLTGKSKQQIDRIIQQAAELNGMPLKKVIKMAYVQAGREKIT